VNKKIGFGLAVCAAMNLSAQTVNVHGKISNASGNPVSQAIVEIVGKGLKDTAGTDGSYSIQRSIVALSPTFSPTGGGITFATGILEVTLADPSPVLIDIADVQGHLLKKEAMPHVSAGVYRWDIGGSIHSENLLLIRVSTDRSKKTFHYLPARTGVARAGESRPARTALAKAAATVDSLRASATGYATKTVPLSSYDTTVNLTLPSGGGCVHAVLKGENILMIGDSWIELPGGHTGTDNQGVKLVDLMKSAGVLGANEVADRRDVSGNTLDQIIGQYNSKSNANVKILIMDGGGIDLFSTPVGSTAAINAVVEKFKTFLQKVKTDGYVEHIIYSLYPVVPTAPNVNTNMKPGFSAACAASPVDCHLVDLGPLFTNQFGSDNTHANPEGATNIANAWWKAMKENCIGQ
jgi:hypothetical protein